MPSCSNRRFEGRCTACRNLGWHGSSCCRLGRRPRLRVLASGRARCKLARSGGGKAERVLLHWLLLLLL